MLFRSFTDIYKENIFLWRYSPLAHSPPQGLYLGRWHPLWQAPGKDQFWVFFFLSISSSVLYFWKSLQFRENLFLSKSKCWFLQSIGSQGLRDQNSRCHLGIQLSKFLHLPIHCTALVWRFRENQICWTLRGQYRSM